MNTSKTIENNKKNGDDWFRLIYVRNSTKYLKDFLIFNPEKYWILKMTSVQRFISYEEFLEFKYSGYIFLKKTIYKKEHIKLWLEYFNGNFFGRSGVQYLTKPLPPFNPFKKIIIK